MSPLARRKIVVMGGTSGGVASLGTTDFEPLESVTYNHDAVGSLQSFQPSAIPGLFKLHGDDLVDLHRCAI